MKKILFLFLFFSGSRFIANCQNANLVSNGHLDTIKIKQAQMLNEKIRLDFAVPDIPAFKAIGADPSEILRPSSVKDLALTFGNFINGRGNGIIPQNFSAEIAPALIIKPWYTLQDYQKKGGIRFLTKSRFSIASNKNDEIGVNSLAIGFRTTFFDKGDFRLNDTFLKDEIFSKQDSLTHHLAQIRNEYIRKNNLTAEEYANLSSEERAKIYDEVAINQFDKDVEAAIEKYKKNNWNASRIDFAYSLLLQSPDSLLGNVKINKNLFWLTWALKPGKNNNWGQLLIGIHDNLYNYNSKVYNSLTSNVRFYIGSNKVKGFFEAQYKNVNSPDAKLETLYSSIGLEVGLFNGIWLHFGTGVENALNGNTKSQLLGNINLNFTFPENFKLF